MVHSDNKKSCIVPHVLANFLLMRLGADPNKVGQLRSFFNGDLPVVVAMGTTLQPRHINRSRTTPQGD